MPRRLAACIPARVRSPIKERQAVELQQLEQQLAEQWEQSWSREP